MISKKWKKTQGFFAFLGFWLTWLFLASLFRFFNFFVFHVLSFLFLFFLFLIIFSRFFHDFLCFAAFSTKKWGKWDEDLAKSWWVTSNHRKNEDKMIQRCKKEKDSKMKSFFVAFFRLRLTWLFSAPIFRFFLSCLFHFFIISDHFLRYLHGFFLVVQHFRPKDEKNVIIYRYIVTCVYFYIQWCTRVYTFTYIYIEMNSLKFMCIYIYGHICIYIYI